MISLVLLLAAAPERRVDVTVAAFSSLPERFGVCVAGHVPQPVEIDLCGFGDTSVLTATSHVFLRKYWRFSSGGFELGLGGGVGARVTRFCPYSVCSLGAGPEALASLELLKWLNDTVGLTIQVDGGLATTWVRSGPGLVDLVIRFPFRAMVGVAFQRSDSCVAFL